MLVQFEIYDDLYEEYTKQLQKKGLAVNGYGSKSRKIQALIFEKALQDIIENDKLDEYIEELGI